MTYRLHVNSIGSGFASALHLSKTFSLPIYQFPSYPVTVTSGESTNIHNYMQLHKPLWKYLKLSPE